MTREARIGFDTVNNHMVQIVSDGRQTEASKNYRVHRWPGASAAYTTAKTNIRDLTREEMLRLWEDRLAKLTLISDKVSRNMADTVVYLNYVKGYAGAEVKLPPIGLYGEAVLTQ